jgi:hypothetical protein
LTIVFTPEVTMFAGETRTTALRRTGLTAQQDKNAAYALFSSEAQVEDVLYSLNLAGFENDSIYVFLPPVHPIAEEIQNAKVGSLSDLSIDAGPAGVLGWLSRLGAVVIPGVGFFSGSREFLRALTTSDRRSPGEPEGLLSGLGIPEPDAARYEARIRSDANLIFVSCEGAARSQWAREILWRMRAEEVRLLGEPDELLPTRREGTLTGLAS